ncbi:sensor histidine kinase [Streptomyces sp. NBC_00209]|uniref:sensor histidine kinase n=1 Tax=Streptomyces sp. NBC_00209 TaxID=2975682 RepID=UPI003243C5E3
MTRYRSLTTIQQFTRVSRVILSCIPWLLMFVLGRPIATNVHFPHATSPLFWAAAGLYLAQAVVATAALASLRRPPIAVTASVTIMCAGQLMAVAYGADDARWIEPEGAALTGVVMVIPLACVWAAERWPASTACGVLACIACVAIAPSNWRICLAGIVAVWGSAALGVHSTLWSLSVMRRLDTARQIEADLAVAEERLRIARDLHDVIGRNLVTIALKSELGARLAKDSPESREELLEIQRIARESQDEVRQVVRGTHSTDLATELHGASSVLESAGINCRIHHVAAHSALPPAERAALGWVIREGVTNVIRHSQARVCTIHITPDENCLTVEITNDCPLEAANPNGTGLKGLAHRVGAVGGTVTHGLGPEGVYHLTVVFPYDKD